MIERKYSELYKEISTTTASEKLKTILGDLDGIRDVSSYHPSTRGDYRVESHEKKFDEGAYQQARKSKPFRKEEWMCKLCMGKSLGPVGTIVDYQVPLKCTIGDEGMGKVDLLSRNKKEAWLLEVKVPDSTESPLRAIMEVYTYWQQLGGDSAQRFLSQSRAAGAETLKKAIVIFEKPESTSPKYLYQKLRADWAQLKPLMDALDVACFVAVLEQDSPDCDQIVDLLPCKL